MFKVVGVKMQGKGKTYDFAPGNLNLVQGDKVIVETSSGLEYGVVSNAGFTKTEDQLFGPLKQVIRKATPRDLQINEENCVIAREAFATAKERIEAHKLQMELVHVACSFDRQRIVFSFISENRVDFRELVKDLAGTFHKRIELRQIGVRDEARLCGALGICGRELCCSQFLEEFAPVSVKMAKLQNLSMNPTKISGACGRLMCCLKYEDDAYRDLADRAPKQGSRVRTPDGVGTVWSVCMLRERVTVVFEDGNSSEQINYGFEELEQLAEPKREDGKSSAAPSKRKRR